MEHVIATWIVAIWQRRKLGDYAPSWDPGGDHSPNSLFAASFAQAGFAMEIPSPELFYELLPVYYVQKIDARRGVKILGLRRHAQRRNVGLHQPVLHGPAHAHGLDLCVLARWTHLLTFKR
ncbi:hypothetical protein [Streptomyces citrinus]|uniref:hypothetical protein n=1 Tax=Streptomyces citrinus TaxID=3118173 RepID=UPI003CC5D8E9